MPAVAGVAEAEEWAAGRDKAEAGAERSEETGAIGQWNLRVP